MELLIAVVTVLFVIVLGGALAWAVPRFDGAVQETKSLVESKGKNYNPALSFGHALDLGTTAELQVKEARLLAARKAANAPRGANMGIGSLGKSTLKTAGKGLEDDPWTAAKIAQFHGWEGARTGFVASAPTAAAAPTAVSVPKPTLIEITDDMSPDEKRKARVANAKANSAYKKALKAAGVDPSAPQPAAASPAAAASAPAAAASVPPPMLIELTDDMSPEEKRKARVANAKANSAYKKALKAAGVDPKAAAAPAPAPTPEPAAAPATAVPSNAPPPPDMIEITDGMAPDEIRRARIANAKAKSAYKKALKEAGIDPATVKI